MGRRIRWLGIVLIVLFGVVLFQLANIQFHKAGALASDPKNPRNASLKFDNQRGQILASDGTVLAQSVPATSGSYKYQRVYPQGSLYSQLVGYDSSIYGTNGIEDQYNDYLVAHTQPAQSLAQLLSPPPKTTDDVTLTINPTLQKTAQEALASASGVNKDGAIVALDPQTGAVLAMYSNPTYDPNPLASPSSTIQTEARLAYLAKDAEGFSPSLPIATAAIFPPGSTFKVITTASVYDLQPQLSNFSAPVLTCTPLPQSNQKLCNDGNTPCGGTIEQMLPPSCDPGYALLGIQVGAQSLNQQAQSFGYNTVPPLDIPGVAASHFPSVTDLDPANQGLPGVAYSAIGQQDVAASALQNALVAAGIANHGTVMAPHLMAQITSSAGNVVSTYKPNPWQVAATPATTAKIIPLMQQVVTNGTASGVGFPASLQAAVKTGTAQAPFNGAETTDDWMIGLAPASNPTIAVAVVVPYQSVSATGAEVAGPIMKAMLEAAAALPAGS